MPHNAARAGRTRMTPPGDSTPGPQRPHLRCPAPNGRHLFSKPPKTSKVCPPPSGHPQLAEKGGSRHVVDHRRHRWRAKSPMLLRFASASTCPCAPRWRRTSSGGTAAARPPGPGHRRSGAPADRPAQPGARGPDPGGGNRPGTEERQMDRPSRFAEASRCGAGRAASAAGQGRG